MQLNVCFIDASEEEETHAENSACYFDTMPDELALHIFGYAANQETAKERFQQLSQLSLVCNHWASLAKDQPFLQSIIHRDKEFIALGKKLANYVSQGKEIAWTCPSYLPRQAKDALKKGLLKSCSLWNLFKKH